MDPLTTNKVKEDAAIAWVMELERANGRQPQDTRYKNAPADIESPPRLIEVKAFGTTTRGYDLPLEVRQIEEARRNPNFYVYVVENVGQGNPAEFTLRVLGGPRLQRLLERAKEYRVTTSPGRSPTTTLAPSAWMGDCTHRRAVGGISGPRGQGAGRAWAPGMDAGPIGAIGVA